MVGSTHVVRGEWSASQRNQYTDGAWGQLDRSSTTLKDWHSYSVHNAFDHAHSFAWLLANKTNSVELDLHDFVYVGDWRRPERQYHSYEGGADWVISHNAIGRVLKPMAWLPTSWRLEATDQARCGRMGSLSACLDELYDFHERHPRHDLITVWLDKKQGWQPRAECDQGDHAPCRVPAGLDELIERFFSSDELFTPSDIQGQNESLADALAVKGWPVMAALRGKLMFVLTGTNGLGSQYLVRSSKRQLWVSAKPQQSSLYPFDLAGYAHDQVAEVAILNLGTSEWDLGAQHFGVGHYLTRGYHLPDDQLRDYHARYGLNFAAGRSRNEYQNEYYSGARQMRSELTKGN